MKLDNRSNVVNMDDNLPKRNAEKLYAKYTGDKYFLFWANYRRGSCSGETILSTKILWRI
jgi:hypothetical protein